MQEAAVEYCLFWWDWWPMCMTKSEWAYWSQAIGAIVALFIAIWVAIKGRSDSAREAFAEINLGYFRAAAGYRQMASACDSQHYASYSSCRRFLLGVLLRSEQVRVGLLKEPVHRKLAHLQSGLIAFLERTPESGVPAWEEVKALAQQNEKKSFTALQEMLLLEPSLAGLLRRLRNWISKE